MNYKDFVSQTSSVFLSAHDAFKESHKLESYAHWFYNQSTGLLRLYNNDSDEIYFKYLPIGTFSPKSNTWMWAWHNESSVEQNKHQTLTIKEFGEAHDYKKLSTGYFPSDEIDGWDFIGIAFKLSGGLCGYRTNTEGIYKYMLLQEIVSSEKARELEDKLIECSQHGKIRAAFICQHLTKDTRTGFEESFPTFPGIPLDEEEELQAWCDDCEKIRAKYDGWNDESMELTKIKLVCERCYFEIKEFNMKK
jgi:hypothetical protein